MKREKSLTKFEETMEATTALQILHDQGKRYDFLSSLTRRQLFIQI